MARRPAHAPARAGKLCETASPAGGFPCASAHMHMPAGTGLETVSCMDAPEPRWFNRIFRWLSGVGATARTRKTGPFDSAQGPSVIRTVRDNSRSYETASAFREAFPAARPPGPAAPAMQNVGHDLTSLYHCTLVLGRVMPKRTGQAFDIGCPRVLEHIDSRWLAGPQSEISFPHTCLYARRPSLWYSRLPRRILCKIAGGTASRSQRLSGYCLSDHLPDPRGF
jgi:hypothetical protein